MEKGMNTFTLTLDDFAPHAKTGLDFKVIELCNKLIDKHPDIKIDLFVPAAYARLGDKLPAYLSKNQKWVDRVKSLPPNYRIGLHGFFHRRSRKDWKHHKAKESNNNEWESLTYEHAKQWLNKIEQEFRSVGLQHSKVFRAPGWYISKGSVRLLADRKYLIAGNNQYYKKYKGIAGLRWKNYNWTINAPCKKQNGNIVAFGHTGTWTSDCMNEKNIEHILKLLYEREFVFKFIEEL